jgi:hypothetical protein
VESRAPRARIPREGLPSNGPGAQDRLEVVREAIAYCESNPPEIADDHRREELLMEATGMNDPEYKYGGKYRMLSPQERARLGI